MTDNENLIKRLEIVADELEDLKRMPMKAAVREAIEVLKDSSERSVQPVIGQHQSLDFHHHTIHNDPDVKNEEMEWTEVLAWLPNNLGNIVYTVIGIIQWEKSVYPDDESEKMERVFLSADPNLGINKFMIEEIYQGLL